MSTYSERDLETFGARIIFFGVVAAIVIMAFFCFTIVPAGHVGIKDTFGKVDDDTFKPGFHLKNPLTSVIAMPIQTRELKETASVPTTEGLIVGLDTSVLYHLNPEQAVQIYKEVGRNYESIIIVPNVRSAVREVTSKYEAKALYSGSRDSLSLEIQDKIVPVLNQRGIVVETVLLRDLALPEQVKTAIETKLRYEQEAQQMEFVLKKETQEAKRKVVEAEGIAQSQAIIDKTLTKEYLQYLWIQQLNTNPNVIYIPIDQNGLTLYRDVDKPNTAVGTSLVK